MISAITAIKGARQMKKSFGKIVESHRIKLNKSRPDYIKDFNIKKDKKNLIDSNLLFNIEKQNTIPTPELTEQLSEILKMNKSESAQIVIQEILNKKEKNLRQKFSKLLKAETTDNKSQELLKVPPVKVKQIEEEKPTFFNKIKSFF